MIALDICSGKTVRRLYIQKIVVTIDSKLVKPQNNNVLYRLIKMRAGKAFVSRFSQTLTRES